MKQGNKTQMKRELQAKGTWDAFLKLRETLVKQGQDRPAAWDEAARAFGYAHLTQRFHGRQSGPADDMDWVEEQVCADEEAMKAAPSQAAKAILQVCRTDPAMLSAFFRQFYLGDGAVTGSDEV